MGKFAKEQDTHKNEKNNREVGSCLYLNLFGQEIIINIPLHILNLLLSKTKLNSTNTPKYEKI